VKSMLDDKNLDQMGQTVQVFSDTAFVSGQSYLIRIRDVDIREYVRYFAWSDAKSKERIDPSEPGLLTKLDSYLGEKGFHAIFLHLDRANTEAIFVTYIDEIPFVIKLPSTILGEVDGANAAGVEPPVEIWDLHIDISHV